MAQARLWYPGKYTNKYLGCTVLLLCGYNTTSYPITAICHGWKLNKRYECLKLQKTKNENVKKNKKTKWAKIEALFHSFTIQFQLFVKKRKRLGAFPTDVNTKVPLSLVSEHRQSDRSRKKETHLYIASRILTISGQFNNFVDSLSRRAVGLLLSYTQ